MPHFGHFMLVYDVLDHLHLNVMHLPLLLMLIVGGIISKNKLWIKNPLNCTWKLRWNNEIESDWIIVFDGIICWIE
jgi:hypothetical protein